MTKITVYTTEPVSVCSRINLLEARQLEYSLIKVLTEKDRTALIEKSGRTSFPLVFVGDELVGGTVETIAADKSGRLAELAPR